MCVSHSPRPPINRRPLPGRLPDGDSNPRELSSASQITHQGHRGVPALQRGRKDPDGTEPRQADERCPKLTDTVLLSNIDRLIADRGSIDVRYSQSVGCIASAADEHIYYATLVRREAETLLELLARLDRAIEVASDTTMTVDEVNAPPPHRR